MPPKLPPHLLFLPRGVGITDGDRQFKIQDPKTIHLFGILDVCIQFPMRALQFCFSLFCLFFVLAVFSKFGML